MNLKQSFLEGVDLGLYVSGILVALFSVVITLTAIPVSIIYLSQDNTQ